MALDTHARETVLKNIPSKYLLIGYYILYKGLRRML